VVGHCAQERFGITRDECGGEDVVQLFLDRAIAGSDASGTEDGR
jgi:hypothetical protein